MQHVYIHTTHKVKFKLSDRIYMYNYNPGIYCTLVCIILCYIHVPVQVLHGAYMVRSAFDVK